MVNWKEEASTKSALGQGIVCLKLEEKNSLWGWIRDMFPNMILGSAQQTFTTSKISTYTSSYFNLYFEKLYPAHHIPWFCE